MDISVTELKERFKQAEPICIIDVREAIEFHTFNIGGENIPLGNLPRMLDELEHEKDVEVIVVCQRGLRSETARRILCQHGYLNVKNLAGGLLAWRKLNY